MKARMKPQEDVPIRTFGVGNLLKIEDMLASWYRVMKNRMCVFGSMRNGYGKFIPHDTRQCIHGTQRPGALKSVLREIFLAKADKNHRLKIFL